MRGEPDKDSEKNENEDWQSQETHQTRELQGRTGDQSSRMLPWSIELYD